MQTFSKAAAAGLTIAIAVSGCTELEPLAEYRPIVDPGRTDQVRFESDLEACRAVAIQVEADYQKRQQEQLGANLMAGLVVGALTGATAAWRTAATRS